MTAGGVLPVSVPLAAIGNGRRAFRGRLGRSVAPSLRELLQPLAGVAARGGEVGGPGAGCPWRAASAIGHGLLGRAPLRCCRRAVVPVPARLLLPDPQPTSVGQQLLYVLGSRRTLTVTASALDTGRMPASGVYLRVGEQGPDDSPTDVKRASAPQEPRHRALAKSQWHPAHQAGVGVAARYADAGRSAEGNSARKLNHGTPTVNQELKRNVFSEARAILQRRSTSLFI